MLLEEIERRLVPDAKQCWIWNGATDADGYGQLMFLGRNWKIHRLIYSLRVGEIPDRLEIDHLCFVRNCANPEHLELVSRQENIKRSALAGRHRSAAITHCPQGHPYAGENLRITGGQRVCKTCARERMRQWRRREAERRGTGPHPRDWTHCPQGHPFAGDNLIITKDGKRRCRTCANGWARAARARKRSVS